MSSRKKKCEDKSFKDIGINSWLQGRCTMIGVRKPTPVQENCIPLILQGKSCIAVARTGSGKTLAFALPILQQLFSDPYGIYALVLTPTRELAHQIGHQFLAMADENDLKIAVITGGADMVKQGQLLTNKPHIVVATPGRLADHIGSCNTFSLAKVKFVVLDEADVLLGGQFDDQISKIFSMLPEDKQMLFFSATMNEALQIAKDISPKEVMVWQEEEDKSRNPKISHYYMLCPEDVKHGYLFQLIKLFKEEHENESMIVFVDNCRFCAILWKALNDVGLECVALNSTMSTSERLESLSRFKSNQVKVLVATDVASRGLDIPSVSLVVNYGFPTSEENYIHRAGRTGRYDRTGRVITFTTSKDELSELVALQKSHGYRFGEYPRDIDEQVCEILLQTSVAIKNARFYFTRHAEWEGRSCKRLKTISDSMSLEALQSSRNFLRYARSFVYVTET